MLAFCKLDTNKKMYWNLNTNTPAIFQRISFRYRWRNIDIQYVTPHSHPHSVPEIPSFMNDSPVKL